MKIPVSSRVTARAPIPASTALASQVLVELGLDVVGEEGAGVSVQEVIKAPGLDGAVEVVGQALAAQAALQDTGAVEAAEHLFDGPGARPGARTALLVDDGIGLGFKGAAQEADAIVAFRSLVRWSKSMRPKRRWSSAGCKRRKLDLSEETA